MNALKESYYPGLDEWKHHHLPFWASPVIRRVMKGWGEGGPQLSQTGLVSRIDILLARKFGSDGYEQIFDHWGSCRKEGQYRGKHLRHLVAQPYMSLKIARDSAAIFESAVGFQIIDVRENAPHHERCVLIEFGPPVKR